MNSHPSNLDTFKNNGPKYPYSYYDDANFVSYENRMAAPDAPHNVAARKAFIESANKEPSFMPILKRPEDFIISNLVERIEKLEESVKTLMADREDTVMLNGDLYLNVAQRQ